MGCVCRIPPPGGHYMCANGTRVCTGCGEKCGPDYRRPDCLRCCCSPCSCRVVTKMPDWNLAARVEKLETAERTRQEAATEQRILDRHVHHLKTERTEAWMGIPAMREQLDRIERLIRDSPVLSTPASRVEQDWLTWFGIAPEAAKKWARSKSHR